MVIVRTIEPEFYYQFVNGEVSNLKVVDAVLGRADANALKKNRAGSWFEAVIIAAAREEAILDHQSKPNSPLLQRYKDASHDADREHAKEVNELVEYLEKNLRDLKPSIGFRQSVRLLELLVL